MPSNLGRNIANLTKAQNYRNVLLIDASYAAILLQYNVIAGTGVLFTALAHGLSLYPVIAAYLERLLLTNTRYYKIRLRLM